MNVFVFSNIVRMSVVRVLAAGVRDSF
jgi:hypothetical protein